MIWFLFCCFSVDTHASVVAVAGGIGLSVVVLIAYRMRKQNNDEYQELLGTSEEV